MGSVGHLAASGTVGLTGERPIALAAKGVLDVAALSIFTDLVRAEGHTNLDIAVRGTVGAPELNGFVELADASFVVDGPTLAADAVSARVDLSGRRLSLARLVGNVNGGTFTGSGFADLGAGGIRDVSLELSTKDVAFDAPLDLRSLSDATIRITQEDDTFLVTGQVTIGEAGLTADINLREGLLAAMGARRQLDVTEERLPLLNRVRFNIDVDTAAPINVDNNLARAEVTADLRVLVRPLNRGCPVASQSSKTVIRSH